MAKKQTPKTDPYVTRAQLAGLTRYGGQEAALVELLREAADRRDAGVRGAKSTSKGTISVIDAARPQLAQVYKDAGFTGQPVPEVQLPAGPASFQSAQAYEQAGAQRSLGRQAAAAIGGLETQRVLAAQGATFGALQAERQYGSDREKIGDRATALQDQRGAYESQVLLGLVDDANDRRAAQRSQQRQIDATNAGREDQQTFQAGENQKGRDATAEKDAAAKRKEARGRLPGGAKKATALQHGEFQDAVAAAEGQVKLLGGDGGMTRAEIATALINGEPETSVDHPTKKDDKGKPVKIKVPGVPKTKQLVASVALDLALDGHVSKRNVAQLHKRGLSLKDLGFETKAPPKRGGLSGIAGVRG